MRTRPCPPRRQHHKRCIACQKSGCTRCLVKFFAAWVWHCPTTACQQQTLRLLNAQRGGSEMEQREGVR